MIATWERYQEDMPEYSLFIEAGLSKLQTYFHHAIQVPAYQLAICIKFHFFKFKVTNIFYCIFSTSSFKEAILVYTTYA